MNNHLIIQTLRRSLSIKNTKIKLYPDHFRIRFCGEWIQMNYPIQINRELKLNQLLK